MTTLFAQGAGDLVDSWIVRANLQEPHVLAFDSAGLAALKFSENM